MLYNVYDQFVGRSFDLYGEFSESEVELFRQIVKPGQTIVEIGANIGAHTVWLAKEVGLTGTVYAIEPQRIVYQTLCANIAINSITNTYCIHAAAGTTIGSIRVPPIDYARTNNFGGLSLDGCLNGESVPMITIDSMNLPNCHFMKIDVEGMEQKVLGGAIRCIEKFWPALYVENDREEKSDSLIRFIDSLGYRMYWHKPPLYNPNNFAGNSQNVFGNIVSGNMICLPKRAHQVVDGFDLVEVPSVR